MPVNPVAPPTAAEPTIASAMGLRSDGLGRDAFLKLLVTQLQNQDPLEPQADTAFLAQLAQFSSLENLQEIKADMAALRRVFVDALDPSTPTA
jgi:flagellar basal-body rod modification protein FlgD